ncbi:FAD-dependent oxidoreductase [Spirulina sp. CS-785/01]|uniref:NAD(P)/FAD-dependent oxidoreductase n=1 Tax=Spirulina sp. CS-785/01 TaxID=3021716 RepID=UPI00232CEC45|nr:FAD-dependent oxidoreductase [Spirulina sp. CS-785/01]MDB9315036.1 FAD-dependent oxidoreductase [Spirulina sp. CS-785/01]
MKHFAVIGGGVVGAAITYELSRLSQLQVTLLEQQEAASGATGAALGILMGVVSQKTKGRAWRLREMSLQRYQTLLPELEALTGLSIPWNNQGLVKLCVQAEDWPRWQRLQAEREQMGWPLELWDRDTLATRCPPIQHGELVGAVYSPQDGQVNPVALTEALIAGARQNGANCRFGVTVRGGIESPAQPPFCRQLDTSQGPLAVDGVIIAAGLGSTPLTEHWQSPVSIFPVLGQGLRVRLAEPLGDVGFQPVIAGEGVNIVPLGGLEYGLGATVEFPDASGVVVADGMELEGLLERAIAICPTLAQAEILQIWSGKRPRPQGRPAPVIEPLANYDNIWLASGHYRNGVLLAPATALMVRDFITNTPWVSTQG